MENESCQSILCFFLKQWKYCLTYVFTHTHLLLSSSSSLIFSLCYPSDLLLFFLFSAPLDSTTVPLPDGCRNNNEVEPWELLSGKALMVYVHLEKLFFFLCKEQKSNNNNNDGKTEIFPGKSLLQLWGAAGPVLVNAA